MAIRYEMQIKTGVYGWEYFDDKAKKEDLNCYSNYKRLYKAGTTNTDARIVKIETIRTVLNEGDNTELFAGTNESLNKLTIK